MRPLESCLAYASGVKEHARVEEWLRAGRRQGAARSTMVTEKACKDALGQATVFVKIFSIGIGRFEVDFGVVERTGEGFLTAAAAD